MEEFPYLKAARRRRRIVAWTLLAPAMWGMFYLALGATVPLARYGLIARASTPFVPPVRPKPDMCLVWMEIQRQAEASERK